MKNVLLYGLSGDPPLGLGGHQGYVNYFTRMSGFDEIWIVPVYRHMFSSKSKLTEWKHRLRMCQIAFEENESVNYQNKAKVVTTEKTIYEKKLAAAGDDIEKQQSIRVGTFDLITHLSKEHPDTSISFVMGSDVYLDFLSGKWFNANEIQELVGIVCIRRIGYDIDSVANEKGLSFSEELPPPKKSAALISIPNLTSAASSAFKEAVKLGDYEYINSEADAQVLQYLKDNHLCGF